MPMANGCRRTSDRLAGGAFDRRAVTREIVSFTIPPTEGAPDYDHSTDEVRARRVSHEAIRTIDALVRDGLRRHRPISESGSRVPDVRRRAPPLRVRRHGGLPAGRHRD